MAGVTLAQHDGADRKLRIIFRRQGGGGGLAYGLPLPDALRLSPSDK